jgi:hypothetical protein
VRNEIQVSSFAGGSHKENAMTGIGSNLLTDRAALRIVVGCVLALALTIRVLVLLLVKHRLQAKNRGTRLRYRIPLTPLRIAKTRVKRSSGTLFPPPAGAADYKQNVLKPVPKTSFGRTRKQDESHHNCG